VVKDQDSPGRRLVVPLKNNLAADSSGLAYTIMADVSGVPYIGWEAKPVTISADEALSTDTDASERQEAQEWLRATLTDGPVDSADILTEGKRRGFSERTLRRAKSELGVHSEKAGFGKSGSWVWGLPNPQEV